jgi:hypothetical protein
VTNTKNIIFGVHCLRQPTPKIGHHFLCRLLKALFVCASALELLKKLADD